MDVLQVAVAALRRLDPSGDPLNTSEGIVKDDLDRIHTLGGSSRDRPTAVDKLGELRAQARLQAVEEPYGQHSAFARRETKPRVRFDDELDTTADHLAIAAGVRPAGAPPDQRVVSWRATTLAALLTHDATTLT